MWVTEWQVVLVRSFIHCGLRWLTGKKLEGEHDVSLHLSWIKHNIWTPNCQPLHHWAPEISTWMCVLLYKLNSDSGESTFWEGVSGLQWGEMSYMIHFRSTSGCLLQLRYQSDFYYVWLESGQLLRAGSSMDISVWLDPGPCNFNLWH